MKARKLILALACVVLASSVSAYGQSVVWSRQLGGGFVPHAGVVDANGIDLVGSGLVPGQIQLGYNDALVRRYDSSGNELWTREFGTVTNDYAWGVASDASGIYVVGSTYGALPGQTNAGHALTQPGFYGTLDAYIRKYDANGTELWTRQFGSLANEYTWGVVVDATGVYVVGQTEGVLPGQTDTGVGNGASDAFIRKYDLNGNELWTRQFGTPFNDNAVAAVVDSTALYVVGSTQGELPGQTKTPFTNYEAFIRKYDANGTELWTRQFAASEHAIGFGVAVDNSGVYVSGAVRGVLPGQTSAGSTDAFVRKYDISGNEVWTRQFGSSLEDDGIALAADGTAVYVTGDTDGVLSGQTSAGAFDAFIRKYDVSGSRLWTRQFGSSGDDFAFDVKTDSSGIYVLGTSGGQTTNPGGFIVKFSNPQVLTVDIDIKPGTYPNTINLGSSGTVPVAILSSSTFDATTVDPTTVTLAGASVALKGKGTPQSTVQDINGDGRLDLVVHVTTDALQLSDTDTEAVLEGQTYSGQLIRGSDTVRIVP